MSKSFLSADWYRVAPLTPRLRGQVDIHRQVFRGDTWYVVQDHHSGKYHRVTPQANFILSMMNGKRSVGQLWEAACDHFEDAPPTQSEVIRLLSQLHSADLIATDLPNIEEIGERHANQERQTMMARLKNPLALRMPILDPDNFLNWTVWAVRPLFTWFGFFVWLAIIWTGFVLMILNWQLLTEGFVDRVLAAENIILLILAYPVLKATHELGHAYATKVWGGEVHEIGIMLLIFMPVPYVDASASAAFASKWRRAVVGGAGIMVELAVASLAQIFWLNAEPGLARAFAFNLMMVGGISTLLFNGNPLLRFDGYFVFADVIEIPGLGQRSNQYFWYLCQRYLLRLKDPENPVRAKGERKWLFFYAIFAFIYRIFIAFAIAAFIASKFFIVGILLAIWALGNTFVKPLGSGIKFLVASPKLRHKRKPILIGVGAGLAAFVGFFALIPLPYATTATGVVWLEPQAFVRTQTNGFMNEVPAELRDVRAGDALFELDEPALASQAKLTRARLQEAQLRLNSVLLIDQVLTDVYRDQIALIEGQLADTQQRADSLVIRAQGDGQVLIPKPQSLNGRLLSQGHAIGYFLDDTPMRLRVAITQGREQLVRQRTESVEMVFLRDLDTTVSGMIVAESPESQRFLPSAALSTEGGGQFTLDPEGARELRALETVFLFDVVPTDNRPVSYIGERALVRFDHGSEPIAFRIWRTARQLFLRQFNV
ncbi:PqqD family peptide modification chaperone [Yoonia sp.]|uniref:PqqD family peptide modification chaperone n=1 Tax=Yoonia sp. TaxID=2212373 RepID=UPI00358EFF4C